MASGCRGSHARPGAPPRLLPAAPQGGAQDRPAAWPAPAPSTRRDPRALTGDRRSRPDVLLLAGGVDITPLRALFESLPRRDGEGLLLLSFARTEDDVLFREELDLVAAAGGGRVHHVVGDREGPLDAVLLARLVPGLRDRDVYFCGPPGMGVAVRRALRELGLPPEQLHEERFAL